MRKTREQWLREVISHYRRVFSFKAAVKLDRKIRISCGWPSKGGTARKNRRLGECWSVTCSQDKSHEIFVSPYLSKAKDLIPVVVHELVHVAVGTENGHNAKFRRVAIAVGLEGPMRSTHAGSWLAADAARLIKRIGKYPHAKLDGTTPEKKQTTRLIKAECPSCGYVIRTTRTWIEVGLPICCCGEEFQTEEKE